MNGHSELRQSSDEQLAVLVQAGDQQATRAYAILYKRHAPGVHAFLAARLRDREEAQDLCQQIWLKVWELLGTHFTAQHFRGWVFQVSRNLLIDHIRRKRHVTVSDEHDPIDYRGEALEEQFAIDERIAFLQPCVDALPQDRKQVVEARLAGSSFDDISESLGIPSNTAMTRFHRAKDQLRECIERRSS